MRIPHGFEVTVPEWVHAELREVPEFITDVAERMGLVHRMAERNVEEGTGGPFAAVVADLPSGRILSVGVNLVLHSGLSSAHAEVVALSLAQRSVGSWELGAAETDVRQLVVNGRPCAMCFGATLWAGIRSLAISVDGHEVEELTGFDEGPVTPDWERELAGRGVELIRDVEREESIRIYRAYGERARRGESLVYNGRGSGPR